MDTSKHAGAQSPFYSLVDSKLNVIIPEILDSEIAPTGVCRDSEIPLTEELNEPMIYEYYWTHFFWNKSFWTCRNF